MYTILNMCIISTRSLHTRQITELRNNYTTYNVLRVDLCANGVGAYVSYAPPLPTGLRMHVQILTHATEEGVVFLVTLSH